MSGLREDWQTYERDWMEPGLWVMLVYRFGRWRYGRTGFIRRPLSLVYKILFVLIRGFTGVELPCEARIGRRCRIYHGMGLVVSGRVIVGDDCILRQGVTLGVRRTGEPDSPTLGNRVDVGVNAVILGGIHIGDDVLIGANSVVLEDVPSHSTAVGNPARILRHASQAPLPIGTPSASGARSANLWPSKP